MDCNKLKVHLETKSFGAGDRVQHTKPKSIQETKEIKKTPIKQKNQPPQTSPAPKNKIK